MFLLFLLFFITFTASIPNNPALHFPIYRRGGRFSGHQPPNMTHLLHTIQAVENRYRHTYRNIEGNRLVRRWVPDHDDQAMLNGAGLSGTWYTKLNIGTPPQAIEVDIDFMSSDFYTLLTTSEGGSKFNTFASQSHDPGNTFVHPLCRLSFDQFHLLQHSSPTELQWAVCQPSKSSRHTLSKSGTVLGLSPQSPLSRISAPSLIHNLHQHGTIPWPGWSLTLLDSTTGILSLGGTLAGEFEDAKIRTEAELKYLGQDDARTLVEDEVVAKMAFAIPDGSTFEDHFKWTDVTGARGWWTGLMGGVWVDGVKVLKNQPFLLDLSSPFIIAPASVFKHLYSSISGSTPLSTFTHLSNINSSDSSHRATKADETFHLFPCLNPPSISFEIAGWPFPLQSPSDTTREDAFHGPAGGPFSLGKISDVLGEDQDDGGEDSTTSDRKIRGANTGFCVGVVVASDMGERNEEGWRDSGMRDVWVLGEPFFRGMGVVFDDGHGGGKGRLGFRRY